MAKELSRRDFLKMAGGAVVVGGGAVAAGGVQYVKSTDVSPHWSKGEVTVIPSTCQMCRWKCGIHVHVADGKVVMIDGHPDDPDSGGGLCARGRAGVMELYDPDRLKQPLIRTGERGDGQYRQATWEEALDFAAEGLKKVKDTWDGPEAVAWFAHGGGEFWFANYLPGAFGSPNAGTPSEAICLTPRNRAAALTFGQEISAHEPVDWAETEYIVLIGNHYGENAHVTHVRGLFGALNRGAKLAVVDPRLSTAASRADHWLQIKPGTDTALLLAWINVLISEGLCDLAYVKKWTVGFDELVEHVQSFTPEWAAKITGLPAEQIVRVAREMGAHAPKVVIPPGRHTVWYGNDTQRMRAVYILSSLLGGVGRSGGLLITKSPFLEEFKHPRLPLTPAAGG